MKTSIRTKFTIGIVFFFVIISVLLIFSAIFMNRMSKKTSAILTENYLSVVYAREMAEGLTNTNREITEVFISDRKIDSSSITKELNDVDQSFQSEKNNITEIGEGELVSGIETGLNQYRDSVRVFIKSPQPVARVLNLQKEYAILYRQLTQLSQMNGKALEAKTDDAKASSKKALTQMALLGTLCFLISLSFTFSFSSYFNERFFQLYNGIKEIVASNYGQRLHFEGNDEFHEISMVFNEMAEKLSKERAKTDLTLLADSGKDDNFSEVQEVKRLLSRLKNIEEQSIQLIARLEKKS